MKRKYFLTLFGFALISALISCLLVFGLRLVNPQFIRAHPALLVSAAASLKETMADIQPLYQKVHPEIDLTFNFGASGALLQQIEQGAPADIFVSAATKQMDILEQKAAIVPETRSNLASNQLVLIAPNNSRSITSFISLKSPKVQRIAIGESRSVPAGQYAAEVLQKLNLANDVQSKLVYGNSVRQVLAVVESGNADAGIVYLTDTQISNKVKIVATADQTLHSPIVYPGAVLKRSKNINEAKTFVQFLARDEAKSVLRKHGFVVPKR